MSSNPASSFSLSSSQAPGDVSLGLHAPAPPDRPSSDRDRDRRRFGGGAETRSCPDVRVEISPSEATERRALAWHGMAVETVKVVSPCRVEARFRAPLHLLILFEDAVRNEGCTWIEGAPRSELRNCTNKLVFVPSGHEFCDWQEASHSSRAVYVYIDPSVLPLETGEASLLPRLFFDDADIQNIVVKLKALAEGIEPLDRHYAEALGVVLAHDLARGGSDKARAERPFRGGLAGWQQRAVASYIEEHVTDPIPLAALAQLARLSPYHFSRAFKQTFGTPPHRFHTQRRIERAKSLLADPGASVTSIGMALGFCETSAFSTAFRRVTGMSPMRFRRSVG
jgi:AraC family transcriptional regulator